MAKAKASKKSTRRQKNPERRAKIVVALTWLFIALCSFIIVFLTYAGGYRLFFSSNPHFKLERLDFSSEGMVPEKLVVEILKEKKLNLYSLSPGQIRQQIIQSHPAIEDVKIIRKFPDVLKISIIEKPVIARINAQGKQWTITEKGLVLKPGQRIGIKALPIINIAGLKEIKEGEFIKMPKVLKALKMLRHSMSAKFTIDERFYTFQQILDIRNVFIRKDNVMLIINGNKKFRVAPYCRVIITLKEYKIGLSRAWRAAFEQSKSKVPYNYIDASNRNVAIRVVNSPIRQ